jgi:hypothetical protein
MELYLNWESFIQVIMQEIPNDLDQLLKQEGTAWVR